MRVLRAGIAGVAVVVLVAACGGGGGSSKKLDLGEFVKGVCGDFSDMTDGFSDALAPLSDVDLSDDSSPDELAAARDAIAQYVDDSIEIVNATRKNIASQGRPDTSDGEEFSKAFQEQFGKLVDGLNNAKKSLKEFDPENDSAEDLQKVFQEFESASSDESDVLDEFDEITDAFSDECPDAFS